jgi:hypothetical protein
MMLSFNRGPRIPGNEFSSIDIPHSLTGKSMWYVIMQVCAVAWSFVLHIKVSLYFS